MRLPLTGDSTECEERVAWGAKRLVSKLASIGPSHDCVVDKLEQFSAELADLRAFRDPCDRPRAWRIIAR